MKLAKIGHNLLKIKSFLALIALFIFFSSHFNNLYVLQQSSRYLADDERQFIPPIKSLLKSDNSKNYINKSYLDNYISPGFRESYFFLFKIFSPEVILKALPWIIYFFTFLVAFIIALKLGGTIVAIGTGLFFFNNYIILSSTFQNIPRNYAFLGCFLYIFFLIKKNFNSILILNVISFLFYPIIGVFGSVLSLVLFINKLINKKITKSTIFLFIISGLLCFTIALTYLADKELYGKSITVNDYERYPEAGKNGRYAYGDYNPFRKGYFIDSVSKRAFQLSDNYSKTIFTYLFHGKYFKLKNVSTYLFYILCILMVIYIILFSKEKNLKFFLYSSLLTYFLALTLFPLLYFPIRYIRFPVISLYVVIVPLLTATLVEKFIKKRELKFLCCIFLFLAMNSFFVYSKDKPDFYYQTKTVNISKNFKCNNSMTFAGWVTSIVNDLPLKKGCNIYLSAETMQAMRTKMISDNRAKMYALIDVFFDKTNNSLKKLYKNFGVTHFIIEGEFLDVKNLIIYEPFNKYINKLKHNNSDKDHSPYIYSNKLLECIYFKQGSIKILNLNCAFNE